MTLNSLLLILLIVLLGWAVFLFNRLVADRNRVAAAWSDIDVQLKRRHDLVPQLVSAVRAYAGHERATMEAVTELRKQSTAAGRLPEKAGIEEQLAAGVQKLLLLAEDYPDLKASRNFLELQKGLVEVEDHLQYARRFYNGAVRIINTRVATIPDTFIARFMQLQPAEYFEADVRERPQVEI